MLHDLRMEQAADYQAYAVGGSHDRIGRETALRGKALLPIGERTNEEMREYARKCREEVGRVYPPLLAEFAGYTAALGEPEDAALHHYSLGVTGACSAVAVRTPQGMRTARNYDFHYWENRRHLIRTEPDRGFAHTGMHEGLIGGRFDGLNEHGLFVCFNGAGPHPERARPGITFHLLVRILLETCRTAEEAVKRLPELPIIEPKSYMLADSREAFVVEAHPERREVRAMEEGVLAMTNHYIHPAMSAYQPPWDNSVARYDRLIAGAKRIRDAGKGDPTEQLGELMADHDAPLCGHVDGLSTFWSCVAEPQTRDIRYSLGAPCRNRYRGYGGMHDDGGVLEPHTRDDRLY